MKKIVLALILVAALVLLTSCGNKVEGTWKLKSGNFLGFSLDGLSMGGMISYNVTLKDGKMTITADGNQVLGLGMSLDTTYKISGNKITVQPVSILGNDYPATYEYKVEGDTMTFTGEGRTIIFEKVK